MGRQGEEAKGAGRSETQVQGDKANGDKARSDKAMGDGKDLVFWT